MTAQHKELKKWIKSTFGTNYKYADFLGYNRITLQYKLSYKIPFTIDDIKKTREHYHLTDSQVVSFFLK